MKKALILPVLLSLSLIPPVVQAKTEPVNQEAAFRNFTQINEIEKYVDDNRNVNVLVVDQEGKVINEFHSDGNVVKYNYDKAGKLLDSTDSYGGKQTYERDRTTNSLVVKSFFKNTLQSQKIVNDALSNSTDAKAVNSENSNNLSSQESQIMPLSFTSYETTFINAPGYGSLNMSNLISDSNFTNSTTMNAAKIQAYLESLNSVLKNPVVVYRYTSNSGSTPVYSPMPPVVPSSAISSAATGYGINPKLILTQIQKESQLVKNTGPANYLDRKFIFATGYGAYDGGFGNWDPQKSGFDMQIIGCASTLRSRYDEAPTSGFPKRAPDSVITSINFGVTKVSNGVTYNNYVWIDNRATYSLYRYTPHTIDTSLLPNIGGGNALLLMVFSGMNFTNGWGNQ